MGTGARLFARTALKPFAQDNHAKRRRLVLCGPSTLLRLAANLHQMIQADTLSLAKVRRRERHFTAIYAFGQVRCGFAVSVAVLSNAFPSCFRCGFISSAWLAIPFRRVQCREPLRQRRYWGRGEGLPEVPPRLPAIVQAGTKRVHNLI